MSAKVCSHHFSHLHFVLLCHTSITSHTTIMILIQVMIHQNPPHLTSLIPTVKLTLHLMIILLPTMQIIHSSQDSAPFQLQKKNSRTISEISASAPCIVILMLLKLPGSKVQPLLFLVLWWSICPN